MRYRFIFLAFALFSCTFLFAQEQTGADMTKPDSTNVFLGEAIGRTNIDKDDLPEEVASSLKSGEYSDMEMIAIYKVDIVPGSETTTDSLINASVEYKSSQRPYSMRQNDMPVNETYYQDTYNDIQTQEQRVGTAQENATDQDMETSSEEQLEQKEMPENVQTYYEIEVNSQSEAFVLFYDESGQLTHSISQKDM